MGNEHMFSDVTPEAIEQANALLEVLEQSINSDWRYIYTAALTGTELELNLKNAEAAMKKAKITVPAGALSGGTGMLKGLARLQGEDTQRAIRLLKQTGRLVQAGQGRGKALLVLQTTKLKPEDFAAEVAQIQQSVPASPIPDHLIDKNDPVQILEALQGLIELAKQSQDLQEQVRQLTEDLSTALERIGQLSDLLEQQQTLSSLTTWS